MLSRQEMGFGAEPRGMRFSAGRFYANKAHCGVHGFGVTYGRSMEITFGRKLRIGERSQKGWVRQPGGKVGLVIWVEHSDKDSSQLRIATQRGPVLVPILLIQDAVIVVVVIIVPPSLLFIRHFIHYGSAIAPAWTEFRPWLWAICSAIAFCELALLWPRVCTLCAPSPFPVLAFWRFPPSPRSIPRRPCYANRFWHGSGRLEAFEHHSPHWFASGCELSSSYETPPGGSPWSASLTCTSRRFCFLRWSPIWRGGQWLWVWCRSGRRICGQGWIPVWQHSRRRSSCKAHAGLCVFVFCSIHDLCGYIKSCTAKADWNFMFSMSLFDTFASLRI